MTTPGVCGAAILALTVTFFADAAAAQTRDFLRAPRVQSRVRLQWDQDARRVVAAPDDDLALQPLTSAPPFLTDAVVHYSIIEDGGFAGFGQGVEWCVTGLDRNWAYGPGCRAARP